MVERIYTGNGGLRSAWSNHLSQAEPIEQLEIPSKRANECHFASERTTDSHSIATTNCSLVAGTLSKGGGEEALTHGAGG
jgi:hypothetical protein